MGDNIVQIVRDNMENFLMKKGLWGLVNGEDECRELRENLNAEEQKEYKTSIEKSRKVLHWILICISGSLIPHIMKASTPKESWDIIHKIYGTSMEARKLHLKQKLHSVKNDDMVSVMLNGVGPQYKSLDTSISVRGTMPDFDELVALCMREEHKERGSSRGRYFSRNANTMDMPRDRGRSNSRGRGRSQAPRNSYHCGKYGHFEEDCYFK
ncbi:hypothetical protein KP509_25G034200 [Ceratopteris richardii]|uniref:CCHC-type domain-containing protein n=1 Tax=Ceratopteris richardii TaxID=49495 RepID=A0A8T2RPB4_CERRI|nr:hypothetical protein KP509_25G034200 [Ceratopteris richardii]